METQQLIENLSPIFRKYWLPIIFVSFGMILLSYGLISLLGSANSSRDIVFEKGNDELSNSPTVSAKTITKEVLVDVEGAVVSPGVYRIASSSRVKDALISAGGLSKNADREWVAKNLNLAAKIIDAGKLYVPFLGENTRSSGGYSGSVNPGASVLVNLNTASEGELDTLPGVGLVTAGKIIEGRPYQTVDELVSKKIIPSRVFEKIKEKISVY